MFATSQFWIRKALPGLVLASVGLWLVAAAPLAYGNADPRAVARGNLVTPPADEHSSGSGGNCRACHTSSEPSQGNVDLRACGRKSEETVAQEFAQLHGPEGVITLNVLSSARDIQNNRDRFGPVSFDHEAHAKWADLSAGCAACHHYTPEGASHPACRTCHESGDKHQDMHKPGLKGAYHRQCLGCHREWSHETKCGVCHEPRDERIGADAAAHASADDIIGVEHPEIPEPEEQFYQTRFGEDEEGTVVRFAHQRHTEQYQCRCVDCHQGDGCVQCHESGNRAAAIARAAQEPHESCSGCHATDDDCDSCHRGANDPMPEAFNHASTGFSLTPHHGQVECRTCHQSYPYTKRSGECSGCHQSWLTRGVDHARVAGLAFDEVHLEIECATCHLNNRLAARPSCAECHDDKEYPRDIPGTRVKTEPARASINASAGSGSGGR